MYSNCTLYTQCKIDLASSTNYLESRIFLQNEGNHMFYIMIMMTIKLH